MTRKILQAFLYVHLCALSSIFHVCAFGDDNTAETSPVKPIALQDGPHLFLDEHLIAESQGIKRKVNQPKRVLPDPVVTSKKGHQNWQPWFTVLYDPKVSAEKPFRMWYTADVVEDPADWMFESKLALLDSRDGIHWPGPFKQLDSAEGILFGASVIDDGSDAANPAERYKLMYFSLAQLGPVVACSPDGLNWKLQNNGRRINKLDKFDNRLDKLDDSWHAGYDPIRKRHFAFGKSHDVYHWINADGQQNVKAVRLFGTCLSQDFKKWDDLNLFFFPDNKDPGITEFYAVDGFFRRGDLLIGFVQILRDDLTAEGAPEKAVKMNMGNDGAGMGVTTLTWTRDGNTWQRDYQNDAFFEPDPKVGAWDHAMAWITSAVPVGDEVYLYYAGYRWGHKLDRSLDRQIGLVKMKRDRFVARSAGGRRGLLVTPWITLDAERITLNVDASRGEVRVQVVDELDWPVYGLTFADCKPIKSDSIAAPVEWDQPLSMIRGKRVRLQFSMKDASLFGFELAGSGASNAALDSTGK